MRTIKQILILALVALIAGHIATSIYRGSSDREIGPEISVPADVLEISASASEKDLLVGITAHDEQDGDLTDHVIVASVSKLVANNTAKVTYLVFDSDDNMAIQFRQIRYTDYRKPWFEIKEPLVYSTTEDISVLDRITAYETAEKEIHQQIRVSTLAGTENSEVYDVTVQVTNAMGDTAWLTLPVLQLDHDPNRPQVLLKDYLIYLEQGEQFDPQDYLDSVLQNGEPVRDATVQVAGTVDSQVPDTYRITYTYPSNGSVGTAILTVVVQ
ncbi:MAG: bacterial Ig-like domain-containing protein [Oscillospiraceae bacterium]|nr:bacterial Ig-like domain-containing protein [Oscillospiraceae bacterium]